MGERGQRCQVNVGAVVGDHSTCTGPDTPEPRRKAWTRGSTDARPFWVTNNVGRKPSTTERLRFGGLHVLSVVRRRLPMQDGTACFTLNCLRSR